MRLLDITIHQAVERDGQPRVGAYSDGSQHMLYRERGVVRSVPLADWPATEAALAAQIAADQTRAAKQAARRSAARGHTPAGQAIDTLTTPQLLELVKALAERAGAVDDDGNVRPYDLWG